MAQEALTLLNRKGAFLSEYGGLFNPQHIDRIVTEGDTTRAVWSRHTTTLNVHDHVADKCHTLAEFIHCKSRDQIASLRKDSLVLFQKTGPQSAVVIDKYGVAEELTGLIETGDMQDGAPHFMQLDADTWFNPANAAMAEIAKDGALRFRVESRDFDNALEDTANVSFMELPMAKDARKTAAALAAVPGMARVDTGSADLFLNMKTLGYVVNKTEDGQACFQCHRHGPSRKPGLVMLDDATAEKIFRQLAENKDLVTVENTTVHPDMVDNAYITLDQPGLRLFIGSDDLRIDCTSSDAAHAVARLAMLPQFRIAGVLPAPGGRELPADVLNLDRAHVLMHDENADQSFALTDNEAIPLNLDRAQMRKFMDRLEAQASCAPGGKSKIKEEAKTLPRVTVPQQVAIKEKDLATLMNALRAPDEDADLALAKANHKAAKAARNAAAEKLYRSSRKIPKF